MPREQLHSMYQATDAINWMTFDEFAEMVDKSSVVQDTNGILSLFDFEVH